MRGDETRPNVDAATGRFVGGPGTRSDTLRGKVQDEPLPETEWGPLGVDRVEFFISPNPGEELRPLARIASGGELSRVMLALKTLTATRDTVQRGRRRLPGVAPPD